MLTGIQIVIETIKKIQLKFKQLNTLFKECILILVFNELFEINFDIKLRVGFIIYFIRFINIVYLNVNNKCNHKWSHLFSKALISVNWFVSTLNNVLSFFLYAIYLFFMYLQPMKTNSFKTTISSVWGARPLLSYTWEWESSTHQFIILMVMAKLTTKLPWSFQV